MSIYPNPFFNNQFTIQLNGDLIGKLEIEIFNMLGQSIYKKADYFNENKIVVNPDKVLEKGMYLVTLKSDNKTYTYKVISK